MARPDRASWGTFAGLLITAALATTANLLHGAVAWAFVAVAGASGLTIASSVLLAWPFPSLGPAQKLEDRALAIANRVRRCDPKSVGQPPYAFSSPYGHRETVLAHLVRIEAARTRRPRRYGPRLNAAVISMINELAENGLRDESLRHFLTNEPELEQLESLGRGIWWLADKRYRAIHGLEPLKLGN